MKACDLSKSMLDYQINFETSCENPTIKEFLNTKNAVNNSKDALISAVFSYAESAKNLGFMEGVNYVLDLLKIAGVTGITDDTLEALAKSFTVDSAISDFAYILPRGTCDNASHAISTIEPVEPFGGKLSESVNDEAGTPANKQPAVQSASMSDYIQRQLTQENKNEIIFYQDYVEKTCFLRAKIDYLIKDSAYNPLIVLVDDAGFNSELISISGLDHNNRTVVTNYEYADYLDLIDVLKHDKLLHLLIQRRADMYNRPVSKFEFTSELLSKLRGYTKEHNINRPIWVIVTTEYPEDDISKLNYLFRYADVVSVFMPVRRALSAVESAYYFESLMNKTANYTVVGVDSYYVQLLKNNILSKYIKDSIKGTSEYAALGWKPEALEFLRSCINTNAIVDMNSDESFNHLCAQITKEDESIYLYRTDLFQRV